MAKRNITATESARRYKALLRALPDLMFVLDRQGNYVDFWADDEQELSVPADQIIGKNVRDVGLEKRDLAQILECIDRAIATDRVQSVEYGLETMQGYGYFEARVVPLGPDEILTVVRNVTSRKSQEDKLRRTSGRLAQEKAALLEKNAAMEHILNHLDKERRSYRAEIIQELLRSVKPIITRMKDGARPPQVREAEFLEAQLNAILASEDDSFLERFQTLTPRELELCRLLRGGMSSKEISDRLNVSLATVHKHREHIRRKLGFQNQQVNLTSFLRLRTSGS